MYIFVATSGIELEIDGGIELESGDGSLLLEDGGTLLVEQTTDLPGVLLLENGDILQLEDSDNEGMISIIDENPILGTYPLQDIYGDIANIPYFVLRLFANTHFGNDGRDTFQGPLTFDLLEGPSEFEIRTPE